MVTAIAKSKGGSANVDEVNRRYRAGEAPIQIADNFGLSSETVDKVISDFLDVLFDLSQPYKSDQETAICDCE